MITIKTAQDLMYIKGPGLGSYGVALPIDTIHGACCVVVNGNYYLEISRLVGTHLLSSSAQIDPTDAHHVVRLFTHAWVEARRGFGGLYATAHGEYFERTGADLCSIQFWPAEILLPPTEHDTMKQPEEPSK